MVDNIYPLLIYILNRLSKPEASYKTGTIPGSPACSNRAASMAQPRNGAKMPRGTEEGVGEGRQRRKKK